MVKYRNILVVINPEEERQIALERAVKGDFSAHEAGGTGAEAELVDGFMHGLRDAPVAREAEIVVVGKTGQPATSITTDVQALHRRTVGEVTAELAAGKRISPPGVDLQGQGGLVGHIERKISSGKKYAIERRSDGPLAWRGIGCPDPTRLAIGQAGISTGTLRAASFLPVDFG